MNFLLEDTQNRIPTPVLLEDISYSIAVFAFLTLLVLLERNFIALQHSTDA